MLKKPIRVAVISSGMIANKAHIPAYLAMGDKVELVGVSDVYGESAQSTAQRHGIKAWFTDPAEMIAQCKPDLVSICSPNASHKPMAQLALENGCHVLCEKPLALTYADTKFLFDLAKEKGLHLVACQSVRANNAFTAAKEFADNGAFGQFYFAEINLIRRRGVPKWGTFHLKEANGGGAFCDLGVHMIDSVLWIMGNPAFEAISGTTASYLAKTETDIITSLAESGAPAGVNNARPYSPGEFEVEEFAAGSMRFAGGVNVNFKISWAVNLPPEFSIKMAGTKGGVILPDMEIYNTTGRYQTDIKPRLFDERPYSGLPFDGHYYIVENLVGALLGEAQLMIHPEETLNVAAVIDAFYRSAAEGREVRAGEITSLV